MEVGQRLFRLTGLPGPDGPFSLSRTHVDGAVVVYPAPRVGAHRVLPHSNQPPGHHASLVVLRQLLPEIVTCLNSTGSLGAPEPSPMPPGSTPFLLTSSRISSPFVTVPNGVYSA